MFALTSMLVGPLEFAMNFVSNATMFKQQNAFETVACKIVVILLGLKCIKEAPGLK